MPAINKISDLRTYAFFPETVFVQGYQTIGDGGEGEFYWDNTDNVSVDNNVTIIKVTGISTGRWKRLNSTFLNVKWFGAIGNGTHDDTPAILNALANLTQGTLFFPDGNYLIRNTISLGSNQFIKGSSRTGTSITLAANSNCTMISANAGSGAQYRIGISNFTLWGNGALQSEADWRGIEIINDFVDQGDAYHIIDNVDVNNARSTAFYIQGRMGESVFTNLTFDFLYVTATPAHPYSVSGYGAYFNTWDATYVNVMGGHTDNVIVIGGSDNHCSNIIGYGSSTASITVSGARNVLANVEAQDSATYGIYIDGNSINISNAKIDSWGYNFVTHGPNANATALYLTSNCYNCNILGLIVDRKEFSGGVATGAYGIYNEGSYNTINMTVQNIKTSLFNNFSYLQSLATFITNEYTLHGQLDNGTPVAYTTLGGTSSVNFSRRVAISPVGAASGDIGYWTKVASVSFGTNTYVDFALQLDFSTNNGTTQSASVLFAGKQNGGASDPPTNLSATILSISAGNFFNYNSFKILTGAFGSSFDIYVQKNVIYGIVMVREASSSILAGATLIYYSNQAWAVLPTTYTYSQTSIGVQIIPPNLTTSQRDALTGISTGTNIYCTNATATDGSTGVQQTWNGSIWKNLW